MGGIYLDQALPLHGIDQIDPIILIHHWRDEMAGGKNQSDVGVGPHPHRGFAPVTFVFEGAMHHRDSLGNSEIVTAGGTQWMHSGSGIVHSERPPKELAQNGGLFEIIQFWVNVPSAHKMAKPYYKPLRGKDTPVFYSDDKKVQIGLVAGAIGEHKGPVDTQSPLTIARVTVQKGGEMTIPLNPTHNMLVYQLDGKLEINGEIEGNVKEMHWFDTDGEAISIKGLEDTRFIILGGEPINEPLATYGPFVMNTQSELMTAMRDYQEGKMGVLNETFD